MASPIVGPMVVNSDTEAGHLQPRPEQQGRATELQLSLRRALFPVSW
jgi:hypothetical protein